MAVRQDQGTLIEWRFGDWQRKRVLVENVSDVSNGFDRSEVLTADACKVCT